MDITEDQLEELQELFGDVAIEKEGGIGFIFIKNALLPSGCTPANVDMLFCPTHKDGYETRLYFAQRVSGPIVRNWTAPTTILDRTWQVFSWRLKNPSELRLAQAIQAHIGGLSK